jgi:hypothetical protein
MNILQEGKKLQPIKLQKSERAVPRHYKGVLLHSMPGFLERFNEKQIYFLTFKRQKRVNFHIKNI